MKENEKIKYIRSQLGITQAGLAMKLGVSKQYLSKIESGGTELSKDKITFLCKTYGISLDWLLLDKGNMLIKNNEANYNLLNSIDNNVISYNKYLNTVAKIINNVYPNATLEDVSNVAKNIYIEDFVQEKIGLLPYEEVESRLNQKINISEEFRYKILALYGKIVVDRLENPNK